MKSNIRGPGARSYYYMVGDTCMRFARKRSSARKFFTTYIREELRKQERDHDYIPVLDNFSIIDGVGFKVPYITVKFPGAHGLPKKLTSCSKRLNEHFYVFCGSKLIGTERSCARALHIMLDAQAAGAHPEYFLMVSGVRERFDVTALPGCSIDELKALNRKSQERRDHVAERKAHVAKQQPGSTSNAYWCDMYYYRRKLAKERLARRMKRESENEEFE